uniref:Uncharacterized protein n=1 Tax=Lactuca sativa TaxID=4236 RepID=A0A9R1VW72_LACSA|nr:hypothetical protein LSAT_V11C400189530 [Lactuca sativa]
MTGLEEKESTKTITVDNDTYNPSVASCHVFENHIEGLSSNLELNLSSALDELLQMDASSSPRSKFVKSNAMDKLHVWKAELTKTLEITKTENDSLEHELKSLVSDTGSFPTEYQNKTCGGPLPVEKTDSSLEEVNGAEDSDDKSSDTTSEFVESVSKCSEDVGNDDALGFVTSCGDRSSYTVSDGEDVDNGTEDDKLYDFIFATNKFVANETSDELNRILLPTTHLCNKISNMNDHGFSCSLVIHPFVSMSATEQVIFDFRFCALLAVAGSLAGSLLCFLYGCVYVVDAYKIYWTSCLKGSLPGKMVIHVYLAGTIMLIFVVGLYGLFISNAPDSIAPADDRAIKGSSLFGMFALRERPKWMKISSLDELKTKVGHVIVMILLVKMFEKSRMVTISNGLELLSYSVCIFLSFSSFLYIYDSNCFASKLSFTL